MENILVEIPEASKACRELINCGCLVHHPVHVLGNVLKIYSRCCKHFIEEKIKHFPLDDIFQ